MAFLIPQPSFPLISHDRAKKEMHMLIVLGLLALYGVYRTVRAAIESLRSLPRSNDEWIWY